MKKLMIAASALYFMGCAFLEKKENQNFKTDDLYIMTFNVENLFDAKHDEGKDDYAFLPLNEKNNRAHQNFCSEIKVKSWKEECLYKDWNEEKLKEKLNRLAGSILQFNSGKGPDMLVLAEVENKTVLNLLNQNHLNGVFSELILIEGDDKRGIDVAIMSKLPIHGKAELHKIPFKFDDPKRAKDTRGILEASFKMPDGSLLTVFALHLPNPSHPHELRTQALDYLNKLAQSYEGLRYIVAAGDFNITSEEDSALKRTENVSKDWLVGHQVGCKGCIGTYYYKPKSNWSFLDWMLFSKNLSDPEKGWYLDQNSIQVLKSYGPQANAEGQPMSFEDAKDPLGVSDHFPVGAIIRKKLQH